MKSERKRGLISLVLAVAVLLSGCAAKKRLTAHEYFVAANKSLAEGAHELAIEQYRELLDQYPFSEYSEEAELKIAQAHYLRGACPEAVASLGDFQRRHPTSASLPMVTYMMGRCYEKQIRPPDRDQSASQNAHAYYVAILQQYPESPFAQLAREQLDRCRTSLAEHELRIAAFYKKRGNTKATETRLLDLVSRFNDTDVAAEALYQLGKLYRDSKRDELAVLAFAAVRIHHPDHERARDVGEILSALGADKSVSGDPLVALRAGSGRSRELALARVTDVEPLEERRAGPGLAPGAIPGSGAPFGRTTGIGPFGY